MTLMFDCLSIARRGAAVGALLVLISTLPAVAQVAAPDPDPQAQASQGQQVPPVTLPTVTVTAQKEPADARRLPVSVTTILADAIRDAGIRDVADAAMYAPNTYFSDFTARKLSNPRFRGIGTSPANPGITTYIDGVPQLNTNSSSVEFHDVSQVEFVRGPQSALFGRNALGGVINITSARPSLGGWTGGLTAPFANFGARELRAGASGPLADRVAVGLSIAHAERDGFTTNVITGNHVDFRQATSGKAQVMWVPADNWETRVIVSGERARDGDYALHDLGALRRDRYQVARDFEGRTNRDVLNTTLLARREGARVTFSSTTGIVGWKTDDLTDLDYSPMPLITRGNVEESLQVTQEVRVASAAAAPIRLGADAALRWQAGVFVFTQQYEQEAVNRFAPFVLSPFMMFGVNQTSPLAALDDAGVGVYGQGTVTLGERLDLTAGLRVDHERKDARLETFFAPAIAPGTLVEADRTFSNVSPQFSAAYRLVPDSMAYVSLARGFKAGGFNPVSLPGSESYGEEYTWHLEGGMKGLWAAGRVAASAAVFSIDWDELQLNLPIPQAPGQFYIANVGGARSRGVEFEVQARPHTGVDVFGAFGYTRARFGAGSISGGQSVADNRIPNTPAYTATLGAQVSRLVRPGITGYGRAETVFYGAFAYDEANLAEQDAYAIANVRAGARGRLLFAEAWIRNAFDTHYVPVAFAYGALAPSGFIGESGRPRTFGVTVGVTF
jgi:iron complex outermembrane recepter protein